MNHDEIAICDRCWTMVADSDHCPDEVAMRLDDGAVRTVPVFDSCAVCEALTVVGEADWTDEEWDAAFGMAVDRIGLENIPVAKPVFKTTATGSKIHAVEDFDFGHGTRAVCGVFANDEVVTAWEPTCKKCKDYVLRFGL